MVALTHWVCFLITDVMAPRIRVVFRRLVSLGSLVVRLGRQANVTKIPEVPRSSSVANYRPISITSVLSNAFERQVSVHPGRFMERSAWCASNHRVCFIGLVWVPVRHFCACPIHCKVHWRVGRRLRSCRLISVQLLIGSSIRAFSITLLCGF